MSYSTSGVSVDQSSVQRRQIQLNLVDEWKEFVFHPWIQIILTARKESVDDNGLTTFNTNRYNHRCSDKNR